MNKVFSPRLHFRVSNKTDGENVKLKWEYNWGIFLLKHHKVQSSSSEQKSICHFLSFELWPSEARNHYLTLYRDNIIMRMKWIITCLILVSNKLYDQKVCDTIDDLRPEVNNTVCVNWKLFHLSHVTLNAASELQAVTLVNKLT